MSEINTMSPELAKALDAQPVTLAQIDKIIDDIERWLVDDPHLANQVKLAKMKIERIFLENVWNTEVIRLAELRTRELQLAVEKLMHTWEGAVIIDARNAANDEDYESIPDNVVSFTGELRKRFPEPIKDYTDLKRVA